MDIVASLRPCMLLQTIPVPREGRWQDDAGEEGAPDGRSADDGISGSHMSQSQGKRKLPFQA